MSGYVTQAERWSTAPAPDWPDRRTAAVRIALLQLPALLLLVAIGLIAAALEVPASAFMRDPAAIVDINPFNGAISHLGVMLWSATAGITFFAALLLRREAGAAGFFLYFGTLTSLLLLDDVFLIHDEIIPSSFSVAEEPIYALYGSILLYGIVRFYRRLWPRAAPLFTLACTFFAVSAGFDLFGESLGGWVYWVEDGAKLLGILNWCACFTLLAATALRGGETISGQRAKGAIYD